MQPSSYNPGVGPAMSPGNRAIPGGVAPLAQRYGFVQHTITKLILDIFISAPLSSAGLPPPLIYPERLTLKHRKQNPHLPTAVGRD